MQAACKPPTNILQFGQKHHSRNTSSVQASSELQSYQTFAYDESSEILQQKSFFDGPLTPQFNYNVRSLNVTCPSVGESLRSFDISNEIRKSKVFFPNFEDLPSLKIECLLSSAESIDDVLGSFTTDYSTKLRSSLENYSLTLSNDQFSAKRGNIEFLEIIHEENTSPKSKEDNPEITFTRQNFQQLQRISTNLKVLKSTLLIQRW